MGDIFFDGPEPPEGQLWCAVCLMIAKQYVVQAEQVLVRKAAASSPEAPPIRVNMLKHLASQELKVAVTRTISTVMPQFGALEVCWSHAIGVDLSGGAVVPASPQEAAMLSQAVPLGNNQQRRR